MPSLKPKDFGVGIGGFRPLQTETVSISLENGGVDRSKSASQLVEAAAVSALDVRVSPGGGVSTDFDYSNYDAAYAGIDKSVMGLAPYELSSGTKFLMRMRPTGWDRWNGASWLTLGGALGGASFNRLNTAVQKDLAGNDLFVAANGVDKLKRWDGNDATLIDDLSADAPVAFYITRIGTRLLAARIKVGGILHPNLLAWSADGNILDWTTVANGAGSSDVLAEGSGRKANYITGLSTVARGAVVYRQQALQLGLLTGQSGAPFRFTTVDFSHGTESPYSIANGGMETGDFFLGSDYMPYNFNGEAQPTPIGGPIHDELLRTIPSLPSVVGGMDTNEQEYWLAYPLVPDGTLSQAWAFNVRDWTLKRRAVWRKRTPPANTKSIGFGAILTVADPIVDTITGIVNSLLTVVDNWGIQTGPDRLLFGDTAGQVRFIDKAVPYTAGSWESRQLRHPQLHELTVDRTRLSYTSTTGGTVMVSVSTDGGATYSAEKACVVGITALGPQFCVVDHGVTGRGFMIRLRPIAGFVTITDLDVTYQDKGLGNG